MKRWIVCLAALSAACSVDPVVEDPTPTAAMDTRAPNTVTLSLKAQADSGVVIAMVSRQAVPEVLRSTARLTNDDNRTWRVGAVAEGRIVRVHANPGDLVAKDQLLAEMHSHDIHESRALYKKAQADLDRAQGIAEYALRLRDRAKRLLELKAGSGAQLEQAETEYRNALTDVRNAGYEVERTRTHLTEVLGIPAEEPDAAHAPGAEDNDLIPVRAPAAGVVLQRNVTPGTVVNPANDLFLISDLTNLWAIAEVSEEHLGKLRVGMPVRVFVQAYPDTPFAGRIGKLGEMLNPATRTIQVRIELTNARGRLKPEMYADAEIELGRGEPALVVPVEAVQDLRGQTVVFVRTGPETFEVRPVRTGRTLEGSYELAAGLKPGERIVTQGAFVLKSEFLKASMAGE